MSGKRRIAILSHGHPELSTGGAERASYSLFTGLKQSDGFDPVYVARAVPSALGHSGDFAAFRGRPDEILWSLPPTDGFRMASLEPDRLERQAVELFRGIGADLVHVHHYVASGTDLLPILKKRLGLSVLLTLHEYLAICHNHGQMLKTNGRLCYASSFAECSACFPERSSGKFFLRKEMILDHFLAVDRFIAPSAFLASRYVEWGVPADRMRVIENPLAPAMPATAPRRQRSAGEPLRLGYFGQVNPFKGIEVLLDAIPLLGELRQSLTLVLFGANIDMQAEAFKTRVSAKLDGLRDIVVNFGSYRNEDVTDLMRSVDWVVVPSTWWENSPVVIQEARSAGVPILCSNIGGMKEKVRPGIDGAHFIVGSSIDLADRIRDIIAGRITPAGDGGAPDADSLGAVIEAYRGMAPAKA